MTQFGVINIGRNLLVEFPMNPATEAGAAPTTDAPTGRTLQLSGQESYPSAPTVATTQLQLSARRADVEGMAGSFVPVTFTDKSELNGYYLVQDASTDLLNWQQEMVTLDWKIDLVRIGTDQEVDIESRLTGGVRNNSFSASGSRWNAPAIGHYGYFTASGNTPSQVSRVGSDGTMIVYFGLPISGNVIPRWGCAVSNYLHGRARFLDDNGLERSGVQFGLGNPAVWTMSNALLQVSMNTPTSTFNVSPYSSGAFHPRAWNLQINGVSLAAPVSLSVLRNEPEILVTRLLWDQAPGRVTADLTLRRGSRFLEMYVQAQVASTIKLALGTPAAGSSGGGGGYVVQTSNDANGNRYIVGSALTNTQDLVNGSISTSASVAMDLFVGTVVGGGSALTGDTAADLYSQYVAAPSELVQGIRR